MSKTGFVMVKNTLDQGMQLYVNRINKVKPVALAKMGLQLLNNVINGSPGASVVPPKLTGHLRASGSVFVGNILAGDTANLPGSGSPNRDHSANMNVITIGFDTPYAAKMHENLAPEGKCYQLGEVSIRSGDVGPFFIRLHIENDGKELMGMYATFIRKEMGG